MRNKISLLLETHTPKKKYIYKKKNTCINTMYIIFKGKSKYVYKNYIQEVYKELYNSNR